MRRLLPLALLLVACAKPEAAPETAANPAPPTLKTPKLKPEDLTPEGMAKLMDVPLYPKSEAPSGMSTMPRIREDGSTHYDLTLATTDSPEKVAAWYGQTLGIEVKGTSIIGKTPKGQDVIFAIAPEAGRTLIRIKSIAYPK